MNSASIFSRLSATRVGLMAMVILTTTLVAGCGLFGGSNDPAATANGGTTTAREIVPTWTSTPEGSAPAATATIAFDAAPVVSADAPAAAAPAAADAASTSVFDNLTPEAIAGSDTGSTTISSTVSTTDTQSATTPVASAPDAKARLSVTQDGINVRTGPGTEYGIGGNANTGESFDIIAKNGSGDWWQVCCVAGEPVWIFGELATVENADSVPVAANIAAPVAAAPVVAAPAAPAPADTPVPAEVAPAPAPSDDPCAGIGGDGCKFKITGGPAFAPNGGGELKLTLAFIHSGDGGRNQSSYFVVLMKDGQNVGVPDSVRSWGPDVDMRDGPNGRYNYEWKTGASDLPGGNIQGNYQIWVLDGNGERDSQTFSFTVPEGQGEIFIKFDQA